MTNPLADTIGAWLVAEAIDRDSYTAVLRRWVLDGYDGSAGSNPVHALERGECTDAQFELALAAELTGPGGGPVTATGLLARMFAATVLDEQMTGLMRALRARGVPTGLLSNSWGTGSYPREVLGELFDAVVISAEVGMRKPEPRIFEHAARAMGVAPQECLFIDDIAANVDAAAGLGFTALLHESASPTVARVRELLQIEVAGQ